MSGRYEVKPGMMVTVKAVCSDSVSDTGVTDLQGLAESKAMFYSG